MDGAKTVNGKNYKRECLMKKNCYFIFAATMLFAAACAQEELPVSGEGSKTETSAENAGLIYIDAVIEEAGDTKSSVDATDGEFKWSTGDKVAVYAAGQYRISEALASDYNEKNSATFAFAGDFGQGDRANFAVFPASLICDEFGDVYPGDQVTAEELVFNLPATYDLSSVQGNMAPTPMIATNASGEGLQFKSICALVKFTLHSIPKQTKYITFDFNGKKVRGEFVIKNVVPGEEATKAVATDTDDYDDVITVYNDKVFDTFQKDLVVNIPVPAGEYTKVTITTWDGDPWDGGHKINGITSPIRTKVTADGNSYESWTAGRVSSGKREIYMPVFTVHGNISIGNGQKVVFAPGNLVADIETMPEYGAEKCILGTGTNWRFAENQYDAVVNSSDNSGNILAAKSVGKAIDLFGWIGSTATGKSTFEEGQQYGLIYPSQSCYPSGDSKRTWDYWTGRDSDWQYILSDWGTLSISGGKDIMGYDSDPYPANTWRLPDDNNQNGTTEWPRLLTARKYLGTYNNNKVIDYCYAKVQMSVGEAVVNGLIVFPDNYDQNVHGTIPAGLPEIKVRNSASSKYSDNPITLEDWAVLESQGCVFLPAAAYRYKPSGIAVDKTGDGVYWTNYAKNDPTKNPDINAIAMMFSDTSVSESILKSTTLNTAKSMARYQGASVRLVRDIN